MRDLAAFLLVLSLLTVFLSSFFTVLLHVTDEHASIIEECVSGGQK
jgi:ABC-type multidrug transport system permease subunit